LTLKKALGDKKLPPATVKIAEMHIGRPAIDPAAETEISLLYRELGGELIDLEKGNVNEAEYRIVGEGFSEFATRVRNLVSVKARVEVKVIDRAGKIVAIDRQTSVCVDLTEILAGKAALQEAVGILAERLLPKIAK